MSAKTGDSVSSCFYRMAADLAGIVLTRPELEVASKIVKAEIVNHPQEDPAGSSPPAERKPARKKGGGGCVLQ